MENTLYSFSGTSKLFTWKDQGEISDNGTVLQNCEFANSEQQNALRHVSKCQEDKSCTVLQSCESADSDSQILLQLDIRKDEQEINDNCTVL